MTTTENASREELQQEADRLTARLAELQQREYEQQMEEARRLADAQAVFDQQLAAEFSRENLDDECDRARAAFDDALAETPVVRAFVDYFAALQRRRVAVTEYNQLLNRLGRDREMVPGHQIPTAEIDFVADYLTQAIRRVVAERMQDEDTARIRRRQDALDRAKSPEGK